MWDYYRDAGGLKRLSDDIDQAAAESLPGPQLRTHSIAPEEDDMMAIPDIPGLTVPPLAPKRSAGADA